MMSTCDWLILFLTIATVEESKCAELFNYTEHYDIGYTPSSEQITLSTPFVLDNRTFSSLYVSFFRGLQC